MLTKRLTGQVLLSMLTAACYVPARGADIYFVDAGATGANDGSTWTDAFTDLRGALLFACANMNGNAQVWVAADTYTPATWAGNPDQREIAFDLCAGLTVYGGLGGTEDPATFDLATRDFVANETILSGDLKQNGDADGTADNSYSVIVGNLGDQSTAVDGLTIRDGNADDALHAGHRARGGGIFIQGGTPRSSRTASSRTTSPTEAAVAPISSSPITSKSRHSWHVRLTPTRRHTATAVL